MTNPRFVYPVRDLESGPKLVRTRVTSEWLEQILGDTEVRPHGEDPGEVSISLSLNGRDVLVRGKLDVTVETPCARTLDPAIYRLKPEVFLLLSKASGGEGRRREGARERRPAGDKRPAAKSKGGWEEDPELSPEDAAQDTYSGDSVILDDFFREFILLELPMVPLREDLREESFAANPPPPGGFPAADGRAVVGTPDESPEKPLDPRLSPLAELKARLEKKDKKE